MSPSQTLQSTWLCNSEVNSSVQKTSMRIPTSSFTKPSCAVLILLPIPHAMKTEL